MSEPKRTLSSRTVAKLIYLTGVRASGYRVVLNGFDGMADIPVNSTAVGNDIVRGLRALASAHPDWVPPSKLGALKPARRAKDADGDGARRG